MGSSSRHAQEFVRGADLLRVNNVFNGVVTGILFAHRVACIFSIAGSSPMSSREAGQAFRDVDKNPHVLEGFEQQ